MGMCTCALSMGGDRIFDDLIAIPRIAPHDRVKEYDWLDRATHNSAGILRDRVFFHQQEP